MSYSLRLLAVAILGNCGNLKWQCETMMKIAKQNTHIHIRGRSHICILRHKRSAVLIWQCGAASNVIKQWQHPRKKSNNVVYIEIIVLKKVFFHFLFGHLRKSLKWNICSFSQSAEIMRNAGKRPMELEMKCCFTLNDFTDICAFVINDNALPDLEVILDSFYVI